MDGDGDGDLDLTPPVDTLPRHHMRPTLLGANILKSIDHTAVGCTPAHLTLGNKITAMCAVLGLYIDKHKYAHNGRPDDALYDRTLENEGCSAPEEMRSGGLRLKGGRLLGPP